MGLSTALLARDRQVASQYLPDNTRETAWNGLTGWVYDFENDLGDDYRMWAYYQPQTSLYRVKMVEPKVHGPVDPHVAHFFPDGDLCLTKDVGTRSLRHAYARSVAFSIGWSWWQRNRTFPFNNE